MNRRSFLGTMLAACAAPAIVSASSIMRIKPILLSGEDFDWNEVSYDINAGAYQGIDRSQNKWWNSHYGDPAIIELVERRLRDAYSIQAKMLDEKIYRYGSLA